VEGEQMAARLKDNKELFIRGEKQEVQKGKKKKGRRVGRPEKIKKNETFGIPTVKQNFNDRTGRGRSPRGS